MGDIFVVFHGLRSFVYVTLNRFSRIELDCEIPTKEWNTLN